MKIPSLFWLDDKSDDSDDSDDFDGYDDYVDYEHDADILFSFATADGVQMISVSHLKI